MGRSNLLFAAQNGDPELVRTLIQKGAPISTFEWEIIGFAFRVKSYPF